MQLAESEDMKIESSPASDVRFHDKAWIRFTISSVLKLNLITHMTR